MIEKLITKREEKINEITRRINQDTNELIQDLILTIKLDNDLTNRLLIKLLQNTYLLYTLKNSEFILVLHVLMNHGCIDHTNRYLTNKLNMGVYTLTNAIKRLCNSEILSMVTIKHKRIIYFHRKFISRLLI